MKHVTCGGWGVILSLCAFLLYCEAVPPAKAPAGSDRGVIAVTAGDYNVHVSWRLLETDPPDAAFHVYRKNVWLNTDWTPATDQPVKATSLLDYPGKEFTGSYLQQPYRYKVVPAWAGAPESTDSAFVFCHPYAKPYFSIRLDGDYTPNAVGIGDLTGDGALDYVIRQPWFNVDPYGNAGYWEQSLEPYKLEAYDGRTRKMLWRYDMGWAIESGIWYAPFMVYDVDGDGFAEVYTKAGEGDPREPDGHVLNGPEYLIKLDGRSGRVVARTDWPDKSGWIDYTRSLRNHLAVAYLDGKTPSLIMQRGTYDILKTVAMDGNLREIWRREAANADPKHKGPGTHAIIAADVDHDGKDEIVLGATTLDDNGQVLWETGLGHPDPCHVADIDPNRPGLEVFFGIEPSRSSNGVCLAAAEDGRILWGYDGPTTHVHDKGMIGDIDPRHPGMECYGGESDRSRFWLYAADGTLISDEGFGTLEPLVLWWDADSLKEMVLRQNLLKYNGPTFMELEGRVLAAADLYGDWREEIICALPGELRIYTTPVPADSRRVWLMQDRLYRLGVSSFSSGYMREAQIGGYGFQQ